MARTTPIQMTRALLLAGFIAVCSASSAVAQEAGSSHVLFTLDARPSGPAVALRGAERVVGSTPLLVPAPLNGRYRFTVIEPGFESPRGDVVFRAREGGLTLESYDGSLRAERAFRSALVPGLGQMHAGAARRGASYLAATLGLGVATLFAQSEFLGDRSDLRDRKSGVVGLSPGEIEARQLSILAAANEQDHSYRLRNALAGATAAVWGLSILDAALFVPAFDVEIMNPGLLSIRANRRSPAGRAARSAVLPGLGQFYAGAELRGLCYLGAETAALGLALAAHLEYERKNDDAEYLLARMRFEERRGDAVAVDRTHAEFRAALGDRDDSYDLRNQAFAAAGVVWALSIIDAIAFDEGSSVKDARASADNGDGEGIRLSCRLEPAGPRLFASVRY
jgi:hypothetical protein